MYDYDKDTLSESTESFANRLAFTETGRVIF